MFAHVSALDDVPVLVHALNIMCLLRSTGLSTFLSLLLQT